MLGLLGLGSLLCLGAGAWLLRQPLALESPLCFDLKPGEQPVSCFHEAFHQRYAPVGLFPGVSQPVGDVEMLVIQTAAALAEPIV